MTDAPDDLNNFTSGFFQSSAFRLGVVEAVAERRMSTEEALRQLNGATEALTERYRKLERGRDVLAAEHAPTRGGRAKRAAEAASPHPK